MKKVMTEELALPNRKYQMIEAVFFGDSLAEIDVRVYALRDFLGLESLNFAQKSRFDMVKEHISN